MLLLKGNIQKTPTKNKDLSWWGKIIKVWNNVPIKTKITTLLLIGATIPVIAVTQGITQVSTRNNINNLQTLLEIDLVTLEDTINSQKKQVEATANILAIAVETATINLGEISEDSNELEKLQSLIKATHLSQPNSSFYIVTDAEGKVIAQFVQKIKGNFADYPLLPKGNQSQSEFT